MIKQIKDLYTETFVTDENGKIVPDFDFNYGCASEDKIKALKKQFEEKESFKKKEQKITMTGKITELVPNQRYFVIGQKGQIYSIRYRVANPEQAEYLNSMRRLFLTKYAAQEQKDKNEEQIAFSDVIDAKSKQKNQGLYHQQYIGRIKKKNKMEGNELKKKKFNQFDEFDKIVKLMSEIYRAKNADYGDFFHKGMEEIGPVYAASKLYDKNSRIQTLLKNPENIKVKSESIEDTLLDIANYAVMTIIELKKNNQEEIK